MKQRYDLLAVSLLMFTAVLAASLAVLPIGFFDMVARWQTLIGGVITFLGVVAASWNVTRQMRLAARGREQDRIERELPGMRAASFYLARFAVAIGKTDYTELMLDEFESRGLDNAKVADFIATVIESLPLTPDAMKRELAFELLKLRRGVKKVVDTERALFKLRTAASIAPRPLVGNAPDYQAKMDVAVAERDRTLIEFEATTLIEFEQYREKLIRHGKSEARKAKKLKRELQRWIALDC